MDQQRLRLEIQGIVQGVGFRPFVYQLAQQFGLKGWVNNSTMGVTIEVEGGRSPLDLFLKKLQTELPVNARIDTLTSDYLEPVHFQEFVIHRSQLGEKTAIVLPDLATCSACLAEIFDPNNRRYHYPFTNCTHCGPRYSIIETLPYDRPLTSMVDFPMCADCQREYEDPGDRRFHAQPNACPKCGCHLAFLSNQGTIIAQREAALNHAIDALQRGEIIALKGLGGFQLLVDASSVAAVAKLRQKKQRPDKPFAVMYPDLDRLNHDCKVSALEEKLLLSPASPIILLQKKQGFSLALNVAPDNPNLGVMLPYTPLHHLLLTTLNFPVVTTSGNLSDEPICIDEQEALDRLRHIADYFLIHNRRILRPVDDSVVRVINQIPIILRRSRGYAPEPILLKQPLNQNILALGAHLKNTVAITQKDRIFVSQHIGDLSNQQTVQAMENTLKKLSQIYDFKPDIITCDLHPDYLSTQYAKTLAQQLNIPLIPVQHHQAHIYACIAEHHLELPILGVAWDGTGYGEDGTIWGGEFFSVEANHCQRIASIKPFPLLGGDQANKEPRRSALSLLLQVFGSIDSIPQNISILKAFSPQELNILTTMWAKKINTPLTSSIGRIFEAIASILGLGQRSSFEGQAAMALEFLIGNRKTDDHYSFTLENEQNISRINLKSMIQAIVKDVELGIEQSLISAKFHQTLVEIILKVAQKNQHKNIVLAGGCFQNKYLLERTIQRLEAENFQVYYPQRFPPNDGAIALGQIIKIVTDDSTKRI